MVLTNGHKVLGKMKLDERLMLIVTFVKDRPHKPYRVSIAAKGKHTGVTKNPVRVIECKDLNDLIDEFEFAFKTFVLPDRPRRFLNDSG